MLTTVQKKKDLHYNKKLMTPEKFSIQETEKPNKKCTNLSL